MALRRCPSICLVWGWAIALVLPHFTELLCNLERKRFSPALLDAKKNAAAQHRATLRWSSWADRQEVLGPGGRSEELTTSVGAKVAMGSTMIKSRPYHREALVLKARQKSFAIRKAWLSLKA